jgi:hypothetical protein
VAAVAPLGETKPIIAMAIKICVGFIVRRSFICHEPDEHRKMPRTNTPRLTARGLSVLCQLRSSMMRSNLA